MFTLTPRIGLVVWVYSLKQIRALRHYGTVMYVSKKMKYAYLYLDQADLEATMAKLEKLRFVRAVEPSHRPELAVAYGPDADTAMNHLIQATHQKGGQARAGDQR
ncbi:YlbG family protein [Lacticaseibacillus baoqingensis]|uniref:YlbG family protein n=1 Tax=Lacticaseibacillus baoqingensis TaxID=2486013 RepID=A0ABW4E770_9LACO|nr:YlbG family protein [Lacticaseibacillus baoqingensis]